MVFLFLIDLTQNSKGSGILLYVRDKIIVLPLNRYSLPPHIEILFFELNLRNQKWLVCCSYNPHKNLIKKHLRVLIQKVLSSIKCKRKIKKIQVRKGLDKESDDDEVISNFGSIIPLMIYQSRMMKWRLEAFMIISGMIFILQLELISILFQQNKLLLFC